MIEYLAPSGGGGSLTLNYIETDLTGSDFTTLNTVPLTIVPAVPDKFIVPIFFQFAYFIAAMPSTMQIADLGAYNATSATGIYFNFNTTDFASNRIGFFTFPVMNFTNVNSWNQAPNIKVNQPIVLTSQVDQGGTNIPSLKIRVGYYILDQF